MNFDLISKLRVENKTKLVLVVMDGLGGLPDEKRGQTALEAAQKPNLNQLAAQGALGLHEPIGPGITSGSGPSHLALFGYDPLEFEVGRGVLAALGISFDLRSEDVAARGNFCSLDKDGKITDRRARRLSSEENRRICQKLKTIRLPGAEVFIETIKEHRFLLVVRGEGLGDQVKDTDPQIVGTAPLEPVPIQPHSQKTSELVRAWVMKATELLRDEQSANGILLRGFSKRPQWPRLPELLGLRAIGLAYYPMYLGLCRLLGMDAEKTENFESSCARFRELRNNYDFFYLHLKETDKAGEDGDFDRKVAAIQKFDSLLPRILEVNPDVLVITGDHSTPATMHAHSWHPVPLLLWGRHVRPDLLKTFGERECLRGSLGPRFPAKELFPFMLAHAGRLKKFGA